MNKIYLRIYKCIVSVRFVLIKQFYLDTKLKKKLNKKYVGIIILYSYNIFNIYIQYTNNIPNINTQRYDRK